MDVSTEHLYSSFSEAEIYSMWLMWLLGWAWIIMGMPSIKKLAKISQRYIQYFQLKVLLNRLPAKKSTLLWLPITPTSSWQKSVPIFPPSRTLVVHIIISFWTQNRIKVKQGKKMLWRNTNILNKNNHFSKWFYLHFSYTC